MRGAIYDNINVVTYQRILEKTRWENWWGGLFVMYNSSEASWLV